MLYAVIWTNINQKEEAIPEMQAAGILGPDGLPNKEKYDWKTIPQGAATYILIVNRSVFVLMLFDSTVAAAFDPRIGGALFHWYYLR